MDKYKWLESNLKFAYLNYNNNNLNETLKCLDEIIYEIIKNDKLLNKDIFLKKTISDIFKAMILNYFYDEKEITENSIYFLLKNQENYKENIQKFCNNFRDNNLIDFIYNVENISEQTLKSAIEIIITNIEKININNMQEMSKYNNFITNSEHRRLKNDFLELVKLLWNIEEYNMWNLQENFSIAYVLDGLNGSEKYYDVYNQLLDYAKKKDYNEFAWKMANMILEIYKIDFKVDNLDIIYAEQKLVEYEKLYHSKKLYSFGFVNEKYIPNWFHQFFDNYIKNEKIKCEYVIRIYLIENYSMSKKRIDDTLNKLKSHFDILFEFYFYVKNGKFKEINPIIVETYSAKQLYNTKKLSVLGAYNYLIYLREKPESALNDLKKGLPNKDSSSK